MNTKHRLLVLIWLSLLALLWAVRWFNPIISEDQQINQAIVAEITILENQILDNKAEWRIREIQKTVLSKEQKVFNIANIEINKQIDGLLDEKALLFK